MFRLISVSKLIIGLQERQLYCLQNDFVLNTYPVAIGKSSSPTPLGNWQIINKKILTEDTIYGTRWLGLSALGYGIHGTNAPTSIGKAVSAGCLRMYNHDIEKIFPIIALGTPVEILPIYRL